MRLVVTGNVGFLGSHVAEMALEAGHEVVGIDNFNDYELISSGYKTVNSKETNFTLLSKYPKFTQIRKDLRNFSEIKSLLQSWIPDYIIHTAAQPTVTLAINNPMYDMENNVLATYNMLEIARLIDSPISICSSIHVFGNDINNNLLEDKTKFTNNPKAFKEDYSFLKGKVTPLHASKAINEIHGLSYIDTYGLKVGIMRFTGMYGPRQFAGMNHGWVSNFIFRMIKGLPLHIFGSDKQVRDILYCTDAVKIFFDFYKKQVAGLYVVSGGINNEISIQEMIAYTSKYLKVEPKIIVDKHRGFDLNYFVGDISKAEINLRWKPKVNYVDGLKLTVDWIKNNIELFEITE
jgi:CDP-paratose 2-epimerase